MTLPTSPLLLAAVVFAFFVGWTLVGLASGYALERLVRRPIWDLPFDEGQLRHEVWGNIGFVLMATLCGTATLASGAILPAGDGWLRGLLTFAALNFAFQAYYYGLHRLLHTKPLIRFHRYHHKSRVTSALSGQSMGVVEAFGWMVGYFGLPFAMNLIEPISFWGWVAYLSYNVVGNIAGHANVELVPPSKTLWVRSTLAAVITFHALHHARWTGHYGFASSWADRLFGTEWSDWPSLHGRVWAGAPMKSLKDKGEERA
jgi:sterol desaturase/sphingolipid hydroxylase (fatty acid hydroxylase superfamily)